MLDAVDPAWEEALLLLQAGFLLEARTGLTARAFMVEELGLEPAYVEGSISTVFLDGKPVDDIDAALVLDGSRLSLSAAMPGLVGAVMRRRSPYASFRSGISHATLGAAVGGGEAAEAACGQGRVRLKLFNAVMRDHGREILGRGVILPVAAARAFADRDSCGSVEGKDAAEELVILRVRPGRG